MLSVQLVKDHELYGVWLLRPWTFFLILLLSMSPIYDGPSKLAQLSWLHALKLFPDSPCAAFKRKVPAGGGERSFVQFILEPLYKLYSQIIGEHRKAVEATLAQLGVALKPSGEGNVPLKIETFQESSSALGEAKDARMWGNGVLA